MKIKSIHLLCFLCALIAMPNSTRAQGSVFTYQGRVTENGVAGSGSNDFTFTLYTAASGGATVGVSNVVEDLAVTNGLFTVTLDFGASAFDGAARWLEIAVRHGASTGSYTKLAPRQAITATPHAIVAGKVTGSVAASQLTGTIGSALLAPGSVTSNQLAAGSVNTSQLAEGAVSMSKLAAGPTVALSLTVTNPTPLIYDQFGETLAALGTDRLIIGAPRDSTGAGSVGSVYLINSSGTLLTTFSNPTPANFDAFGSSVATLANTHIVIGAKAGDAGVTNAGAAYLFTTNGALITTFTNPSPASGDLFGITIAALGTDRVVIGATHDDTGASDSGSVYVFHTNGALVTTINNPNPFSSAHFGIALASLGSDKIFIGSQSDSTASLFAGAVFLYNTNGTRLGTFTKPFPVQNDWFGHSIAVVGTDKVLIGAPLDDTGSSDAGAAYLFSTNGTLLMTFPNPTPQASDEFGTSVAAVGTDRVLIGAEQDDTGGTNSGAAYLFSTSSALLATIVNPEPAVGDYFSGSMVALGADKLAIGARFDDLGSVDSGVVHLLRLETYVPGLISAGIVDGAITPADFDPSIGVWSKSGTNLFHSAGNVGIGTSTPTEKLHVAGNILATGAIIGNGSALTNLSATNLSGTIPDARLSANVARRDVANEFNGQIRLNSFDGFSQSSVGNFYIDAPFIIGGRMTVSTNGRVGIGTNNPQSALHVVGTVTATAFNPPSDRNLKENFVPVSPREVLEKVAALPITRWNFKGDAATPHVGPMAQDFHAAFSLGTDERHIATVDADGVALAAIQGLNQIVQDRDARIAALEKSLAELKEVVANMTEKKRAENRPAR
jgi:hypothetical protein